jgi:tetratricopeptide (TPR) repeat protein
LNLKGTKTKTYGIIIIIGVILITIFLSISDIKFYYYNEMADYSMQNNNYLKAIDYYNKIIDINDSIYEVYFNKGAALIKLRDYDNALKTFDEAKQLNSNDCELYYNLGLIYQLTNEMDMSNSMFEKTIEINPDYFKAYSIY